MFGRKCQLDENISTIFWFGVAFRELLILEKYFLNVAEGVIYYLLWLPRYICTKNYGPLSRSAKIFKKKQSNVKVCRDIFIRRNRRQTHVPNDIDENSYLFNLFRSSGPDGSYIKSTIKMVRMPWRVRERSYLKLVHDIRTGVEGADPRSYTPVHFHSKLIPFLLPISER